jgi:hypothetical protein
MKRWHVLVPAPEGAKAVYDALIDAGFEASQIHAFAKNNADLTRVGVPAPTPMEADAVAGAGVGGMVTRMLGTAPADPKIVTFENELDAGGVLLVVVFPADRADRLRAIVERHPSARCPEMRAG